MSATCDSSSEDLPLRKEPVEVINGRLSAVPSITSGFDPNLRMAYLDSFSGEFCYLQCIVRNKVITPSGGRLLIIALLFIIPSK